MGSRLRAQEHFHTPKAAAPTWPLGTFWRAPQMSEVVGEWRLRVGDSSLRSHSRPTIQLGGTEAPAHQSA